MHQPNVRFHVRSTVRFGVRSPSEVRTGQLCCLLFCMFLPTCDFGVPGPSLRALASPPAFQVCR